MTSIFKQKNNTYFCPVFLKRNYQQQKTPIPLSAQMLFAHAQKANASTA